MGGCMFGLVAGLLAPAPARAITAEQFSQLTYAQVKGSGLANRCPTVESQGTSIPVKDGQRIVNMCFEPKSFAVEADGMDFQATTVKLPDGEYVPFLFSMKALQAKGSGSEFKPGFLGRRVRGAFIPHGWLPRPQGPRNVHRLRSSS